MKTHYLVLISAALLIGVALVGTTAAMSPLDNSDSVLDPDGDGLTNVEEFNAGTDPGNPDTDNDGLPDGWEWDFSLDPTDPSDADDDEDYSGGEEYAAFTQVPGPHYTNYNEYYRYVKDDPDGNPLYLHTNPQNPDSDGDGELDPDDKYPLGDDDGIDPKSPKLKDKPYPGPIIPDQDSDDDGIDDADEYEIGTDPNNADTDGDGLSDGGEIKFGLDPNDWDTDNDLLKDASEKGLDRQSTDGHYIDTDNDGI